MFILTIDHKVIFLDDFNLSGTYFLPDNEGMHVNCFQSKITEVLFDLFIKNNFVQHINILNESGSLFDLIFHILLNSRPLLVRMR